MTSEELQIKWAKEFYKQSREDITNPILQPKSFEIKPEDKEAIENLVERGIFKKSGNYFKGTPETRFFIENGKTHLEIIKEKEEKREEDKLNISTKALKISGLAFGVSFISLILAIVTMIIK